MANISSYPQKQPKLGDRILFSESYDPTEDDPAIGNPTKSATIQSIINLVPSSGGGGGSGTVKSVTGTGTVSGITLSGTVTDNGQLTLGGALEIDPADITSAIGYTPYNASNPNGFTSFAEPAIFSGGGTPTLASGVTAEEIRTLIGADSGEGTNLSSQLSSTTLTINSSTGNGIIIVAATGSIGGIMTAADKTKLDGIDNVSTNFVKNTNDTFSASPKVTQIVTLSQAEYDNANKYAEYLYIIVD